MDLEPVFETRGLSICTDTGSREGRLIVQDADVAVHRGEVLALVGESGSGKTTIGLTALGYCRPGLRFAGGTVRLFGQDISRMSPADLGSLRGRRVAYLAQSAAATFNPSMSVGYQVTETAVVNGIMTTAQAKAHALDLFRELRLPEPDRIGSRYPHQLSGGQLQRLMLAMALCSEPELLVLDEPTTALDVTTQLEVLRTIRSSISRRNIAAIYISHDLAVVAQVADHVAVINEGRVLEQAPVARFIDGGETDYSKHLIDAAQRPTVGPIDREHEGAPADDRDLLIAEGLSVSYRSSGPAPDLALANVNLTLGKGRTVAVIGESGSGKSTLARTVIGLLHPLSGHLSLSGSDLPLRHADRSIDQHRRIQFVHQMADTALNPRQTVSKILGRPLAFYHGIRGRARRDRIVELLTMVGLPATFARRYPTELSGGQKQRVNLARALAADPDVIICDEVISALDSIVAANLLALLKKLQADVGVSFIFITHDISVAAEFSHSIIVIHNGKVVASGPTRQVLSPPYHPHTKKLIEAVPELRVGWLEEFEDKDQAEPEQVREA